jgi:hypothetical protein
MADLANLTSRLQARFADVLRHSGDRDEFWQARVVELENMNKDLHDHIQLLSHQNAELEHKIAQQKPEMDNALYSRQDAFRRLGHSYKVIRDLVNRVKKIFIDSPMIFTNVSS